MTLTGPSHPSAPPPVPPPHPAGERKPLGPPTAPDPVLAPVPAPQPSARLRPAWLSFLRRFLRHRAALFGLAVLGVLGVACVAASSITGFDQNQQDLLLGPTGPSLRHPFGTDDLGRDYLTEVLHAGRISLGVGLGVAVCSTVVGALAGVVAGYFGRAADQAIMGFTDLFLVVPSVAILAVGVQRFGDGGLTIVAVLSAVGWMTVTRVVRNQTLSLRERDFVAAARVAGATHRHIIVRRLLPNLAGPISVNASLAMGVAIVTESTLSFLGFGVQPPRASWGNLLAGARGLVGTDKSHLLYFPVLMLVLTVLAVNFVGDGLRDALDPRSGEHRP